MKNIDKAMMHCYRELYANATPPASFDELLENATVNEQRQKVIPFLDYEIDEDVFEEIVADTIKVYKINRSFLKQSFRFTILLGCSPKFKKP
jgi:Mg/Co/Ni transporter MgtE